MEGDYHKLFGLLSETLWSVSFNEEIDREEAGALIELADKQAVAGLVIDTLIKKDLRMEQETLLDAIGYLEQIKQDNRLMNRKVADFARLMADTRTDYIIVKGQTLAALYPEPLVRMSGDIDFLVKDYKNSANVLSQQWGVELPYQIVEKEFAFTHGEVLYELHTYLIDFGSNKHKRYWERALAESIPAKIMIGGEEVKVMEPTLYAVYIFIHLFFHFLKEGVGLRHLCDWAVMMHYYINEIDKERLADVLKNVGLIKAFLAFGSILVDKLGMKDFPLPLSEKDRKLQRRILDDIFRSGNFGQEKRKTEEVGLRYKIETMLFVLSNSLRYFPLAPKEMILLPCRRFEVNLRLLRKECAI